MPAYALHEWGHAWQWKSRQEQNKPLAWIHECVQKICWNTFTMWNMLIIRKYHTCLFNIYDKQKYSKKISFEIINLWRYSYAYILLNDYFVTSIFMWNSLKNHDHEFSTGLRYTNKISHVEYMKSNPRRQETRAHGLNFLVINFL